jgi:glutathione S-transferase
MATTTDLNLHFYFGTRAMKVQWLANELGVKLQLENVVLSKGTKNTTQNSRLARICLISADTLTGEQKQDAYLAINPHGSVPTLVDGDVTIIESQAILMYLSDKFGKFHISSSAVIDSSPISAHHLHRAMPKKQLTTKPSSIHPLWNLQ